MCRGPLDRQQALADANVLQLAAQGPCFIKLPVRLPNDVLSHKDAGMSGGFVIQEARLDVVVKRFLARIPGMGRPCWETFLANGDVGEGGTIMFREFQAIVRVPKEVVLELGSHEIEGQAVEAQFVELIDTGGDLILACRKVREMLSQACDATGAAERRETDSRAAMREDMRLDRDVVGGYEGEGYHQYLRRLVCQPVFSWCLPLCVLKE